MDHLVITSEEENAVNGTTSNCWGIGLNCVAQSLIVNNFRRVMTTCQRQGTWTLQVGPLGIVHQKFLLIFVHQKRLTSIMRNSHSLHCLVEMSPFEAVVPGKTRRPGPVPTNNEMIKHKNKWWKIKTKGKKIKPRKELPEYGQDYAGDAFLCIASISLHFTASICISLHLSPFLFILSFIF